MGMGCSEGGGGGGVSHCAGLIQIPGQWEWGAVRECKSLCGPHSDSWSLLRSSGNGVQ